MLLKWHLIECSSHGKFLALLVASESHVDGPKCLHKWTTCHMWMPGQPPCGEPPLRRTRVARPIGPDACAGGRTTRLMRRAGPCTLAQRETAASLTMCEYSQGGAAASCLQCCAAVLESNPVLCDCPQTGGPRQHAPSCLQHAPFCLQRRHHLPLPLSRHNLPPLCRASPFPQVHGQRSAPAGRGGVRRVVQRTVLVQLSVGGTCDAKAPRGGVTRPEPPR